MPRTKEEFLAYAREKRAARSNRSEIDNSSTNGGNEVISDSLWRADQSISQSNEIARGTTEDVYDSDGYSTENSTESDGTSSGSDGSYTYVTNGIGYEDSGYGEDYRSTHQSSIDVLRPTTRTIKKRTSMVDDAVGNLTKMFGVNKKKPKPTVEKVVSSTARKLLTIAEVSRNKPVLIKTLLWSSEQLDSGISAITKGHREIEIWSNMEYKDAEILVDALQSAGQQSEWVATRVRQIMSYETKAKALAIAAPRLARTIIYLFTTGFDIRMW